MAAKVIVVVAVAAAAVVVVVTVVSVFLETCSIALSRGKYKNTKHMHIRHSKQEVSQQLC